MDAMTDNQHSKKWQCRWATPHDRDALLALFESAFGQPMPGGLWQWKYARQKKPGMLAYIEDGIIAYYGGMPRTFSLNGKAIKAVQICDVMVAPKMRGILTRRGPFMQTADTFLSEQAGTDKPFRFAFGFPSDRHARLGEKTGWYTRSGTFLETVWPAKLAQPHLSVWFKTRPLGLHDSTTVNTLWQIMQSTLPDCLIPRKDADFFNWRYHRHPSYAYTTYVVSRRWRNKPVGIFALRDHGPGHGMELMDLLGPPDTLPILLNTALRITKRAGRKRLFSWVTPAVLERLPTPETTQTISGVYVTPDYKQKIEEQHLHWWLMGGDTDFH
ncbi:Acetyltransferase (GNAT) domain-containing protein [Nitrosomonas sp. Nm51]|nr:Acetyltransferase (GNAT) domain-containing protein [Nitrosomonas sp. Nm51]